MTTERIRYARWQNASSLNLAPFKVDVTLPFNPYASTSGTRIAGNEYHMLKSSGCYVHLAYAAQATPAEEPLTQTWNIYYRRVLVGPCRADLTLNGIVDTEDAATFFDGYLESSPFADMNSDEVLDGDDVDIFVDVFCNGCTVPI